MPPPYGRRIRAARAFAGLSQKELGEALELDEQTIKRREADKQEPKAGERLAIARVCGVPVDFIEEGFGVAPAVQPEDDIAAQLLAKWEAFEAFAHNTTQDALAARNAIFGEIRHRLDKIEHNQVQVLTELEDVNLPEIARQVADLQRLALAWGERFAASGLPAPSGELARRLAEAERNERDRQPGETPEERDAQQGNG